MDEITLIHTGWGFKDTKLIFYTFCQLKIHPTAKHFKYVPRAQFSS